jgi:DMATS type aromatic prenyltransferase
MGSSAPSLYEHLGGQLRVLCENLGLAPDPAIADVRDLLAPIGGRALSQPPLWPSEVSDDHTPIEFSIACDVGTPPALRILGETIAPQPSQQANLDAALHLVDALADRHNLALDRFHHVRDVFLGNEPQGVFSVWFSLVHRPGSAPDVKIYVDPNAQGRDKASQLVAEVLDRLQLAGAYQTTLAHAVRPGQLGNGDRFSFFALDLHARPHSRVKMYLAHEKATVREVVRAAGAVDGVDAAQIEDFLTLTGCTGPLTKRPLMSGYSFVEGDTDRPSMYSLYLPIRDYVSDDEQAWERVQAVFERYGLDSSVIDKAISAVAQRPLRDGVGLIAHVSLRLSSGRSPGVTVYLSSEAYGVAPPRPRLAGAVAAPPAIRLVPSGDEGPLRIPVRSASQRCT